MSCDHELANEWARCSGKNASYIPIPFMKRAKSTCSVRVTKLRAYKQLNHAIGISAFTTPINWLEIKSTIWLVTSVTKKIMSIKATPSYFKIRPLDLDFYRRTDGEGRSPERELPNRRSLRRRKVALEKHYLLGLGFWNNLALVSQRELDHMFRYGGLSWKCFSNASVHLPAGNLVKQF